MYIFHPLGTAASVKQITKQSRPYVQFTLVLVGYCRIRIREMARESPFPVAAITQVDHDDIGGEEVCHNSGLVDVTRVNVRDPCT